MSLFTFRAGNLTVVYIICPLWPQRDLDHRQLAPLALRLLLLQFASSLLVNLASYQCSFQLPIACFCQACYQRKEVWSGLLLNLQGFRCKFYLKLLLHNMLCILTALRDLHRLRYCRPYLQAHAYK